ncbi:ABC transporter ATP-binding protein [Mollicutes bacterium LVI A0078]|nr:ABC transporter ATP-binding protein [Mollicutes bacterium LVI A0075]WOO91392.1 ABC transporter ATP-binding protein [Mollicutes bacterium LVI A0078]
MNILRVTNVSKSFSNNQVINNLSFTVKAGNIYGFLGQNGAGKTTVMKMILGLYSIDSGEIYVNDTQVSFGQNKTNQFIGYLADVPAFYDYMNAREYLKLCGDISKVNNVNSRITEMLELVGLDDNKTKIRGYSRGMRQRLGIAQALLHKPLLLICDEPTSSLDPIGRIQILDILKNAASETTIIFSTHVLSDVERICDHVGILHEGKIALDTDINTLQSKYNNHNIQLTFSSATDLEKFIANTTFEYMTEDLQLLITNANLKDVYNQIATTQLYPTNLELVKPNLESIFLEVTNV